MSGYVYFAKVGDLVKIGYSSKIIQRMGQLAICHKEDGTKFLIAYPGDRREELSRHKQFKLLLARGREYFSIPDDLLRDIIQSIREMHPGYVIDPESNTHMSNSINCAAALRVWGIINGSKSADIQRATVGVSPDVMHMVEVTAADRSTSVFKVMSDAVEEVAGREFKKLGVKL